MFRKLRTTKQAVEQVGMYIAPAIENFEENRDAYRAAAIGFGVGAAVVFALRSRPVVVNTTINLCNH